MKNLFFLLTFSWLLSCQNNEGVQEIRSSDGPNAGLVRNPISADMPLDTNQLARIRFDEPTFDFGTIKEGDQIEHKYTFTNTGKVPLVIQRARSSCGCTTPDWPKDPIPPGGTGEILAKFNSEGRTLKQKKAITVTANTHPSETSIILEGFVQE